MIGPQELIPIFAIIVLLFGASKLPELASPWEVQWANSRKLRRNPN